MRLLSLQIENFKGVDSARVAFREHGITVVQGPNEIGKSTIQEAFALLLKELDSSKKQQIKDSAQVHNDAGPKVTAEFVSGPYRVRYSKRWIKNIETKLELMEPTPGNLTGRPAHERVASILEETLDPALWAALQHVQGDGLKQVSFAGSQAFMGALDAASGGSTYSDDGASESLWESAVAEREKYFTSTGKRRGEYETADGRVQASLEVLESTRAEIRAIEEDVERHVTLTGELRDLDDEGLDAEKQLIDARASWEAVAGTVGQKDQLKAARDTAEATLTLAKQKRDARSAQVSDLAKAEAGLSDLKQTDEAEAGKLTAANAARDAARKASREASTKLTAARAEEREATKERELIAESFSLDAMKTRLASVEKELTAIGEAEDLIRSIPIDDEAIDEIAAADQAQAIAKAKLDASRLSLEFVAHADVALGTPDGPQMLDAGKAISFEVATGDSFEVADLMSLRVVGTGEQQDLSVQLETAEAELSRVLKEYKLDGANAVETATRMNRERANAESTIKSSREAVNTALMEITPEELKAKIARQEARLAGLQGQRGDAATTNSGEAREREEAAVGAREAAEAALELAEQAKGSAEESAGELVAIHSAAAARLEQATADVASRRATLELSRKNDLNDLQIQEAFEKAQTDFDSKAEDLSKLEKELLNLNVDSIEAELKSATGRVSRIQIAKQTKQDLLNQTIGRLELQNAKGLQEQLDAAESEHLVASRSAQALGRQAAAAATLYSALGARRDEAKRAVIKPYKDRLERLGRIVFGPDVRFAIDPDSLEVESRALNGRTVKFGSLSGGAKEQIAVLASLACAELVATDENQEDRGAPIILDDALGFSDQGRLKQLGAAFSAASDDCQVIVLTCDPTRYRHIGDAEFVTFGETSPDDAPS